MSMVKTTSILNIVCLDLIRLKTVSRQLCNSEPGLIVQSWLISFIFADSVKFADDLHLSASDLLTPNAASNTSSQSNLHSNQDHGNKVLPSDLSKILLKNSRLHSSLDHIDKSAPGSPGPVSRQRSRTLPQSESLPPVCITSDYHSRTNTPDIIGKGRKQLLASYIQINVASSAV